MPKVDPVEHESTYVTDLAGPPLRWPPPGLEPLQGLAWRAVALLAVGTGIMILPMLLSVATRQTFWSTGVFGSSWWVPVVAALVGLLIVLAGMERLTRILIDGTRAVRSGHDWVTIAYVVTDTRHDGGFLLQGARMYATLEERDRRMLLAARAGSAAAYILALLWIPVAFSLGVILAGHGVIGGGGGLSTLVLFPSGLLAIAALIAHGFDIHTTRGMLRVWRHNSERDVHLADEVADWRADRATRLIHLTPASRRIVPARVMTGVLIALAVLLPIPITTIALATAMGPVLAQLAIPRLDSSASRIAKAAMLEPYALPATDTMTPLEAGELLHALATIGAFGRRSPIERDPVRRFDVWPREAKPASLPDVAAFGTQLIPRAAELTDEEVAYLQRVIEYPAHAELSRLARAPAADIAGGRWDTSLLAGMSVLEMPVPRFGGLRDATQFHVAKAVLELSRGEVEAADTTLREIISVGLLLTREGPTLIDVLVGTSIAASGAAALQTLYHTVDRIPEADALRRPGEGVDAMENVVRALRDDREIDDGLRRSMNMTIDESLPRGMRWEGLIAIQIGAACLNPHTVVFGQDEGYDHWIESTRKSFVRYPSEQALFELTLRGPMIPRELHNRASIMQSILGLTLGRDQAAGTCASLLTGLTSN